MLNELKSERMIGYACISSTKFSADSLEEVRKSKAYIELAQRFHESFLNPDCIVVDVISGPTRKRHSLAEIVDTFKNGENWYQSPKGTVVVESLSSLGTQPEIACNNYLMLVKEDIGILILGTEHTEFSTVDHGGTYIKEPAERTAFAEQIRNLELKSKRGKKKVERVFSPEFKELYWLFENYFIPESLVYYNTLIGKTTHVTFDRYCADYERSPGYAADEAEQLVNGIDQKPKRFGKAPPEFAEYCSLVVNGKMTLKDASQQIGVSPITFNRFILKGTGRQAMSKATYAYKRQDIIDAITPPEDIDK